MRILTEGVTTQVIRVSLQGIILSTAIARKQLPQISCNDKL